MIITTLTDALVAWAKAAVPAATVFYGEPDGPRPPPPSIRLKIIAGPTMIGLDEVRSVAGSSTDFTIEGPRELTLSVNCIGPAALQMASDLQTSLSDPSVQLTLSAAGLTSLTTSALRDLSAFVETKFEQRCQFDVELMSTEIKTIAPGVVEHISGTGTVHGGQAGDVVLPFVSDKSP